MSEPIVLQTEKREGTGSRKAAKLRKAGKVPGVLYGHKETTVSFSVDHDQLVALVKTGARVIDFTYETAAEKAQIMELQYDYLGKDILHVDLKRVSANERITLKVRVDLRGIAPGASKGVLDQPLHTLNVECSAISVPDSIKVNISELQLGQSIYVKDLTLPPGVKVLDDPDAIVVHVTTPDLEPAAGAAAESAEPEVIRKAKAEAEAEEK
ncbi:MAG: 50S ribosomal protein L25 [Planctomycetia bacterium]|nr:50S ribosomal protein L25 [Planctomycetia bacterium]